MAFFLAFSRDGNAALDWMYPAPLLILLGVLLMVVTWLWLQARRAPAARKGHREIRADRGNEPKSSSAASSMTAQHEAVRPWLAEVTQDFAGNADHRWLLVPGRPLVNIERALRRAWRILDDHHPGLEAEDGGRLEFRLTFMTRSYRDGHITVAAWANREQRRPRSLAKRQDDRAVYAGSVTAAIYDMPEPAGVITPDGTVPRDPRNFHIYPEEPSIILSHMAWPVLSPDSEMLGTFVVDVNRRNVFEPKDRVVWQRFCEPFIEMIALEKLQLDSASLPAPTALDDGPASWAEPPF